MVDINSLNAELLANPWIMYIVIATLVWKLIWYGLAIFNTIDKKQKSWFVVLFIGAFVLNDLGILAIIYLIINRDKKKTKAKKK